VTPVPGSSPSGLAVGDVLRHRLLESVATYRVVGRQGDLLELEVVDVPGLARGQRFRYTSAAIARMELVSPGADRAKRRSAFEASLVEPGSRRIVGPSKNA
jgi:hypothetical protein